MNYLDAKRLTGTSGDFGGTESSPSQTQTIVTSNLQVNSNTYAYFGLRIGASSTLLGKKIGKIEFYVSRTNLSAGQLGYLQIINSSGTVKLNDSFSITSKIGTSIDWVSFTPTSFVTLESGDRIVLKSTDGGASNYLTFGYIASNGYDSTNTYLTYATYHPNWTDDTAQDAGFKIYVYNDVLVPKKLIPLNGCKAYYKFEESSGNLINHATTANGFTDGLGSSVDGTPSGGVTQTTTGKIGNGWSFDGSNDYVGLQSSDLGNTWTISLWVKGQTASQGVAYWQILGKGTADGNEEINLGAYGSNLDLEFSAANFFVPIATVDDGNWHNMVIVCQIGVTNGTTWYIDNVLKATGTAGSAATRNTQLFIGKLGRSYGQGDFFRGTMDELSIWNRALTTSEITELYNSGAGRLLTAQNDPQSNSLFTETDTGRIYWYDGSTWTKTISLSGLKAYYKFEETSGNLINQATAIGSPDSLGSAVDGTASNLTYSQSGKIGNACSFNASNSSVETAGDIMPSTFTAMTINAWIKPSSVRASYIVGTSPYDGNTNNWFNIITQAGGTIQYAGGTNAAQDYLSSTTSYSTSQWQMVTLVYDGSQSGSNKLKGYFNGTQEGTSVGNIATSHTQSTRLSIGKQGSSGQPFFGGNLDEVSFWNRALTASEITKLYNNGSGKLL